MKIEIIAKPKEVKSGKFNYSNIESNYGVNTQYFTKDGKSYTVIAGELHFSRLGIITRKSRGSLIFRATRIFLHFFQFAGILICPAFCVSVRGVTAKLLGAVFRKE